MAFNIKTPPPLSKSTSYDAWLKEIEIWQTFTDLAKTKQGPAIFLSLEGRAREAVLELEVSVISSETGVAEIISKLNGLYLKDKAQSAYEAYDAFETFKRPDNMSMNDFIIEFERLYKKSENFGTKLSTDVLAYRLLKSANISKQHEQLAKATLDELKYDQMKNQLKKIFGDSCRPTGSSDIGELSIKQEPSFLCEDGSEEVMYGSNNRNYRGFMGRRGFNSRGRFQPNRFGKKPEQHRKPKGRNPLNEKGEMTRCSLCDSVNHWASYCPGAIYFTDDPVNCAPEDETHQITLFQSSLVTTDQMKVFVAETFNTAVLDSGATANVAGQTWIDCYVESLSPEQKAQVLYSDSNRTFKFGSDRSFESIYKVKIPATIGSNELFIETDVVDTHVPLLLSKEAMKKADTKIDFRNDTVTMFGKNQPIHLTKSGHYSVALDNKLKVMKKVNRNQAKVVLHISDELENKNAVAKKLHNQFVHPPSDRLIKLVSSAGLGEDLELISAIKKVSQSCKICAEYRRPASKPTVGMPLATSFNQVVAMDLKNFNGMWILHLIDHVSRYSAASYVS